jgi:hypothetical protein
MRIKMNQTNEREPKPERFNQTKETIWRRTTKQTKERIDRERCNKPNKKINMKRRSNKTNQTNRETT